MPAQRGRFAKRPYADSFGNLFKLLNLLSFSNDRIGILSYRTSTILTVRISPPDSSRAKYIPAGKVEAFHVTDW